MHLGNARTFFVNWLLARQNGWKILLRIEDLDGPRIKAGADRELIEDLRWLGLDWDGPPIYQSSRVNLYQQAIAKLVESKQAYACVCTRREAALAASAPHSEDRTAIYSGRCRGRFISPEEARRQTGRPAAIRFLVPNETITFVDELLGEKRFDMSRELGDFVIAKADGTPAYQLAVVVDDADMGVTEVVRGDDLLDSTPRQLLLYRALRLEANRPRYWHLPLVVGPDGRRLAKRHGDTRLSAYRQAGVRPERIMALLGRWCGIKGQVNSAAEMLGRFQLAAMPRERIVFMERDEAFLRG
ncbi:MAG TPA: tRNA glutamyl-Q(34) synthetase GluQRS [Tepidisphaeraceae bacterium]|nr:tRNA glutamyl-Q(34) synthetase GluQRS [Tepidisphaeraceae bacterium]